MERLAAALGDRYRLEGPLAPNGTAEGLGVDPSDQMDAELSPDEQGLAYVRDADGRPVEGTRGTGSIFRNSEDRWSGSS